MNQNKKQPRKRTRKLKESRARYRNILNRNFHLHEVKTMVDKLKGKKAAGIDTIISELFKNLDVPTLNIIVNILNKVFDSGEFPEEWAVAIVVILFKGGKRTT